MEKIIKIVLAALFLMCVIDMPYGFYQLVRFIAMVSFGFLAFKANENGKQTEMLIYGTLALLFQPLFKIALGRELRNIIDVVVGIGLLISVLKEKTKE